MPNHQQWHLDLLTAPFVTTPLQSCIQVKAKLLCLSQKNSTVNRSQMLMKSEQTSFLLMRDYVLPNGLAWKTIKTVVLIEVT